MTQKEKNTGVARELFSNAFWRGEYFPRYFSESFAMEFPSAPPGMPNYFCTWEAERCFEWLNRTVMSWSVDLQEFYPTPDENQFWAVGICRGDVYWGKDPGHFQTKFFARMEFEDGKVRYMKGWMDSLAFLYAANLEVPKIEKKVSDPRIDEWLENTPARWVADKREKTVKTDDPYEGLDMSEEAIQKHLKDNLDAYVSGIEREKYRSELESYSGDFKGCGWFIPDYKPWSSLPRVDYSIANNSDPKYQKKDAESLEAKRREHAWVKVSSPWMYRDTRGNIYPTDGGEVYFIERMSNGPSLWVGNGFENGHYHQQYLMILHVDKAGRVSKREEVLCPQYKYASTAISLPSFPYYA